MSGPILSNLEELFHLISDRELEEQEAERHLRQFESIAERALCAGGKVTMSPSTRESPMTGSVQSI